MTSVVSLPAVFTLDLAPTERTTVSSLSSEPYSFLFRGWGEGSQGAPQPHRPQAPATFLAIFGVLLILSSIVSSPNSKLSLVRSPKLLYSPPEVFNPPSLAPSSSYSPISELKRRKKRARGVRAWGGGLGPSPKGSLSLNPHFCTPGQQPAPRSPEDRSPLPLLAPTFWAHEAPSRQRHRGARREVAGAAPLADYVSVRVSVSEQGRGWVPGLWPTGEEEPQISQPGAGPGRGPDLGGSAAAHCCRPAWRLVPRPLQAPAPGAEHATS